MRKPDENDFKPFRPHFEQVEYEPTKSEQIQFWIAFIALIIFGLVSIVFVY